MANGLEILTPSRVLLDKEHTCSAPPTGSEPAFQQLLCLLVGFGLPRAHLRVLEPQPEGPREQSLLTSLILTSQILAPVQASSECSVCQSRCSCAGMLCIISKTANVCYVHVSVVSQCLNVFGEIRLVQITQS